MIIDPFLSFGSTFLEQAQEFDRRLRRQMRKARRARGKNAWHWPVLPRGPIAPIGAAGLIMVGVTVGSLIGWCRFLPQSFGWTAEADLTVQSVLLTFVVVYVSVLFDLGVRRIATHPSFAGAPISDEDVFKFASSTLWGIPICFFAVFLCVPAIGSLPIPTNADPDFVEL